jgi:hypothetical protein
VWRARGAVVDLEGHLPASTLAAVLTRRDYRQATTDLVRSGVADHEQLNA